MNEGVNPIDTATLAGQVRLLVGDTDPKPLDPPQPGMGEYYWYSDTELEALAALHGNKPKRTAIWVLSQVAINQALMLRKWTSEDLQIDGPAIAAGIEKTLARLSKEAEAEDMTADEFFDVVYPEAHGRYLNHQLDVWLF